MAVMKIIQLPSLPGFLHSNEDDNLTCHADLDWATVKLSHLNFKQQMILLANTHFQTARVCVPYHAYSEHPVETAVTLEYFQSHCRGERV